MTDTSPHAPEGAQVITRGPAAPPDPTPTADDLFVVYLGEPPDAALVGRLVAVGGSRVASHDPYWDAYGVTVEDPDGNRLVLCARSWT